MIVVAAFLAFQTKAAPNDLPRLLNQIRASYRTCKTYRDTGSQTIWTLENGKKTLWGEWKFSTVFLRPGRIRCEVSERSKDGKRWLTSVIWTVKQPGDYAKLARNSDEPTPYPVDLTMALDGSLHTKNGFTAALASLNSLSFGSFDTVPELLLPSAIMPSLLDTTDLRWVGEEKLGTRNCFILASKELEPQFWFDRRSCLLIRSKQTSSTETGKSSITLKQYVPLVNVVVQESEFKGPKAIGSDNRF